MELHDRIRQLRQEKRWTQAELAQRLGIHQKQISAYERGVNTPSTEILIRLSDILDVSLDYLAFDMEGVTAKVEIKDRELLRQFERIDRLGEKDKVLVKQILDLVIMKNNFQNILDHENTKSA
jgi:transcriptional regulator with XRE-family HTH domain